MSDLFRKAFICMGRVARMLAVLLSDVAEELKRLGSRSRVVQKSNGRSLYETPAKDLFWLNSTGHLDQSIIQAGVFEPWTTQAVKMLIKRGDIVLDVGANIGYYSILMSKLVGKEGKVICFEPTDCYGNVLEKNIAENKLTNVEAYRIGLSNKEQELEIQIGISSATLHVPGNIKLNCSERIKLVTLDKFLEEHPLPKINFIKIDVDGHEPLVLEGAWRSIDKYQPNILLEVSHTHYLNAGYTAWDFYDLLKSKGYYIYHEKKLDEISSKEEFLFKCANFAYSANIVIGKNILYVARQVF